MNQAMIFRLISLSPEKLKNNDEWSDEEGQVEAANYSYESSELNFSVSPIMKKLKATNLTQTFE